MMDAFLNVLEAVCLVLGCLMSLGAAIGLIRFPDILSRLHAGTKPQVFGLMLLLLAVLPSLGRSEFLIPTLATPRKPHPKMSYCLHHIQSRGCS